MNSEVLKKLAAVADSLDSKGYFDESNAIDSIMQKISKRMDPVGKEDADVDNDGDEDSSDEYLAKRRKAISKAKAKAKKSPKAKSKK